MTLLNLCDQITTGAPRALPKNHPMGTRLVCPEYSRSGKEVKSYPLMDQDRLFAIVWKFSDHDTLSTTMLPAPEKFSYTTDFPENARTQLHTHDYIELAYVAEGSFTQYILGKEFTMNKGELVLVDKNCLHQDILGNGPATIIFLGITGDVFSEIIAENADATRLVSFLTEALLEQKSLEQYLHFRPQEGSIAEKTNADGENGGASKNDSAGGDSGGIQNPMETCLYGLLTELNEHQVGYSYVCKGLLLRIFRLLSSRYEFALTRDQKKTIQWIIYEDIMNYINEHYQTVTISELTEVFHFQEDYFNRLIKKQTSLTYSEYVQKIRMEHAARMLLHSKKSVETIAEEVGYNNRGFFYHIFQEQYGMTPAKYRKANR